MNMEADHPPVSMGYSTNVHLHYAYTRSLMPLSKHINS